jgi:hypothetical protein
MAERGNPNWKNPDGTGKTGNPLGRPRKPEIELFREALEKVEKEKNMTLLEYATRQAFKSENVLIALMKKMLPDKMEDEGLKQLARTFLIRSQK